jgi:hypothetical protein
VSDRVDELAKRICDYAKETYRFRECRILVDALIAEVARGAHKDDADLLMLCADQYDQMASTSKNKSDARSWTRVARSYRESERSIRRWSKRK